MKRLITSRSRATRWPTRACAWAGLLLSCSWANAQIKPSAGMMRFPDLGAEKIVFVYGEDLWLVPREGGVAQPLAAPAGEESLPRFSGDGQTIAFVGNYDGNSDIYTIPTAGGIAERVTWSGAAELLTDWTADGELIFSTNAYAGLERQTQLLVVKPDGSGERELPVPYGSNGVLSGDGKWLAYTPYNADYRTWKRYRGGMAPDIWLLNVETKVSKQITDFEGTDTIPMWHGDKIYYLSDAGPEHRLNIWMYDTRTGERQQITRFSDFDCRWPAIGPGPQQQGEIVLTNGPHLYLVDLGTQQSRVIEVTVPGDRPRLRPRTIDVAESIVAADISATGQRIAVEARGDVWTLPVKDGSPRNLTRTSGVAEREPTWSPDGRHIAYFSDAHGEYQLCIRAADGSGEPEFLTPATPGYLYSPTWSPDSKWLTYSDKTGALFLYSFADKSVKQIDRDPTADPVSVNWSHNSEWLVYARAEDQRSPNSSIFLYNVREGSQHRVTSDFYNDASPVFDRQGNHLFFVSSRSFTSPKYEDLGSTFIYSETQMLLAVPLRPDVPYPFLDKSDEEPVKKPAEEKPADQAPEKPAETAGAAATTPVANAGESAAKAGDKPAAETAKPAPSDRLVIDFAGIESRVFALPLRPGNFSGLAVNDKGQLIYGRSSGRGGGSGGPALHLFDLKDPKKEEKKVLDDAGRFAMTSDGKKLLVAKGRSWYVIDAAADQKPTAGVPTAGMLATIEPREEWAQVFREAWRIQRDFFYDPHMHGVDWEAVRKNYAAMLDDCVSRRDVSFLISEMISELNVGHAYYREGDVERGPSRNVGTLGCRWELHEGAWRVGEIFRGAAWDVDARNPLDLAGVKSGEYLWAVNGVPVSPERNPAAAFQGLAGLTVVLTVGPQPTPNDQGRTIPVRLLSSDSELRFRWWIENNRRRVDEQTQGRVGYIYVVNTGVPGQNDLVRQLYGQKNKEALIIDDRWNGGGQIPTRFIELLNRPVTNYWARRDGTDWTWPTDSHQGPKCMLINGLAGSGGDMFPALFRQNGLGKLIGTRTWGGLVGISGGPTMIDGSSVSPPTFAYYELDGTWGIEGHGVDPDIRVVDDPALMQNGGDPQLQRAIEQMLLELRDGGYKKPPRPAYPDRSGMGLNPADK